MILPKICVFSLGCLLCSVFSAIAQIDVSISDTNYIKEMTEDLHRGPYKILKRSLPDGQYRIYYDASCDTLMCLTELKDGLEYGEERRYYPDGVLWSLCYYDEEGHLTGESRNFRQNGSLSMIAHWSSGTANGKAERWDYGVKVDSRGYAMGRPEGIACKRFQNGTIHSLDYYKDGRKEGISIYRYSNGESEFLLVLMYSNGLMVSRAQFILSSWELKGVNKFFEHVID